MMNLTIIISMHFSRDPLYPNYVGRVLVSVHLCYLVFLGASKTYCVSRIISYLQCVFLEIPICYTVSVTYFRV